MGWRDDDSRYDALVAAEPEMLAGASLKAALLRSSRAGSRLQVTSGSSGRAGSPAMIVAGRCSASCSPAVGRGPRVDRARGHLYRPFTHERDLGEPSRKRSSEGLAADPRKCFCSTAFAWWARWWSSRGHHASPKPEQLANTS